MILSYILRGIVGVVALATGILYPGAGTEPALHTAVVTLGAFIVAHAIVEGTFMGARKTEGSSDQKDLIAFAGAFVSTSGVILGLLVLFGQQKKLTTTLRLGIVSLVVDILVGIVLSGFLLAGATNDDGWVYGIVVTAFNIALWAVAFGLLCIGMALVYS